MIAFYIVAFDDVVFVFWETSYSFTPSSDTKMISSSDESVLVGMFSLLFELSELSLISIFPLSLLPYVGSEGVAKKY